MLTKHVNLLDDDDGRFYIAISNEFLSSLGDIFSGVDEDDYNLRVAGEIIYHSWGVDYYERGIQLGYRSRYVDKYLTEMELAPYRKLVDWLNTLLPQADCKPQMSSAYNFVH